MNASEKQNTDRTAFLILILSVMLGASLSSVSGQPDRNCPDCDRRALLVEFTNPSNPDYEQKRQEWRDCMSNILGDYVTFDDDDPRISSAVEQCAGFEPDNDNYCYPEIISVYLAEHLTNPCFHMLSRYYFTPGENKDPEYIFKGSYETNIEGGRLIDRGDSIMMPVICRMTLKLYYNGTSPELVKEWSSENIYYSPKGLFHKLNLPKSLNQMLYDFEKRPVKCEVDMPSPEEICKGGEAEIVLSNFTDASGNASKPFNRVVVSIYRGEILNGEASDLGPDYRVYTLKEGEVKIKYRPPADKGDGYDWLRVYNTCEILPPEKAPMAGTLTREMIVDEHFPVSCGFYEGNITVTKSWDYKTQNDGYVRILRGTQTVIYNGAFKPLPEMKDLEGQPIKMYGASSATGTWKHYEQEFCEGDCSCKGLVYEKQGSGTVPPLTMQGLILITNSWPTEMKEVADQLAQFGLENWYDIAVPTETVPASSRSKGGEECSWSSSESSVVLTGADIRFKLETIDLLKGSVSWSSSRGSSGVSATNLTEAAGGQKPYDPEQDGAYYKYTITWDLKAL